MDAPAYFGESDAIAVPLTNSHRVALIDARDAHLLERRWHLWGSTGRGYVRDSKHRLMHREIVNAQRGQYVDHANHDGLDNRRVNLRLCTNAQNIRNSRKSTRPGLTSKFKGVNKLKQANVWAAEITVSYERIRLGYYKLEEDAARAYDRAARDHFGEFAVLNFADEAS